MEKLSQARQALFNLLFLLLCITPGIAPLLRTETQAWQEPGKGLVDLAYFAVGAFITAVGVTGIRETTGKIRVAQQAGKGIPRSEIFLLVAADMFVLNGLVGVLTPIMNPPVLLGLAFSAILTVLLLYWMLSPTLE